jgi:hypothetical protein
MSMFSEKRRDSMPKQSSPHLIDSIATAKARLRRLEAALRNEEREAQQDRWIAAGKVVEACGLLDMEEGDLATILKLGMEAWVRSDRQVSSDT